MALHRSKSNETNLEVGNLILRYLIWGSLGGLTLSIGGYFLIDLAAAFVGLFVGFFIGGVFGVAARLDLSEKAQKWIKKAAIVLAVPPEIVAFIWVTNLMGAVIGDDGMLALIGMVIGAIAAALIWGLGAVILFLVISWIWALITY